MLSLGLTISVIRKIIGKRITSIGSNRLLISEGEMSSIDKFIVISFEGGFSLTLTSTFFESEHGEVFQDYAIEEGNNNRPYEILTTYNLRSPVINKIEIFGRNFPLDDFKDYPEILKQYGATDRTDDVFVLYVDDDKYMSIVFHNYSPQIYVYFGNSIENFFYYSREIHP